MDLSGSWSRLVLVLACLGAAALGNACAGAAPRPQAPLPAAQAAAATSVTVRSSTLELELTGSPADGAELPALGSGFLQAADQVSRWGGFRSRVEVRVLQDHRALEEAVGRPGHPWLRAWAFGQLVLLQSPRSWEGPVLQSLDVQELLTHELTHALMYQLIEPSDWPAFGTLASPGVLEEPPLWFREGMASVTAGQGPKRLSPAELTRWLRDHPGKNPLQPDGELVRTEKEAVYGAAHRAFELLLELGGDQAVRDVMRGMRSGARFQDAFAAATGRQLQRFEDEALRQGFTPGSAARMPRTVGSGAGGP